MTDELCDLCGKRKGHYADGCQAGMDWNNGDVQGCDGVSLIGDNDGEADAEVVREALRAPTLRKERDDLCTQVAFLEREADAMHKTMDDFLHGTPEDPAEFRAALAEALDGWEAREIEVITSTNGPTLARVEASARGDRARIAELRAKHLEGK